MFPKFEAHYAREQSLDPELNLNIMYSLYKVKSIAVKFESIQRK